ncbi:MAG: glycosyltransferase family 39 protein [Lewinellaceae bacterium]|nr:glycosyltransferase family 39 protein [Lewinellaceae bacterium]
MKKTFWSGFLLVFILSFFPLFMHLDSLPLFVYDEGRTANSALEMVQNGNWLVVHYDGKPELWSTKPPFLIWMQALSMKAFGFNLLAVRLPSALAGLATILAVFAFLWRQTHSLIPPLAASLALLTMPGFVAIHSTRTGDYDALLTLWSTLFLLQFFLFCQEKTVGKRNKHLWLSLVFFTLGVLTKGIAIFLFLPGLLLFLGASRRLLPLLRNPHFYYATLASTGVIASYYLFREWAGPGYLAAVVQNELGGRFLHVVEGHHGPWYYYFEALVLEKCRPWIGFVPIAIWYSFRDPQGARRPLWGFLLWNTLAFLLILSMAQTKLHWYIIPVLPLLSLAIGGVVGILIERIEDTSGRPFLVQGLVIFALFLFPFIHQIQQSYQIRDKLPEWETRQYGPYMKIVQDWPSYTAVETNYNAHLAFYVKIYRAKGQDLKRKYPHELSQGDTILLCEDHARNAVLARWSIKPLHTYKNCGLYLVKEK